MQYLKSPGAGPIPSVPAQQPTNLFRFGEITLYSTHAFAAGTALANGRFNLFASAQGNPGQGYGTPLTLAETNLLTPGQVPHGQAFDIYGVATHVIGGQTLNGEIVLQCEPFNNTSTIRDLQNIVNNCVLRWAFTQSFIDICPVQLSGAGGGVYGALSTNAADTTAGAMNNGNGGIWMYRVHPVSLPGSTAFRVELVFGQRACPVQGLINNDEESPLSIAVRVVLLGFYRSVIEIA
jgi:hypothetical protein